MLGSRPAQSPQGSQPVPGTAGQLGQRLWLEDALEPGLPSGTNWRKHAGCSSPSGWPLLWVAMASVPSIGCLLARNQYYRKASVSSAASLAASESVSFTDDDKARQGPGATSGLASPPAGRSWPVLHRPFQTGRAFLQGQAPASLWVNSRLRPPLPSSTSL
nr:pancreatic progenitor cell differentiation and proliferation factor-like protein isoform X1 [Vicugna pacos]